MLSEIKPNSEGYLSNSRLLLSSLSGLLASQVTVQGGDQPCGTAMLPAAHMGMDWVMP